MRRASTIPTPLLHAYTFKRPRYALRGLLLLACLAYLGLWMLSLVTFSSSGVCRQRLEGLGISEAALEASPVLSHALARHRTYERMAAQLDTHGLTIGGVQTQGLGTQLLFASGVEGLHPVLTRLARPVRAVVLPVEDRAAAAALRSAAEAALGPIAAPNGVWLQDAALYHATLFHASPHHHPVAASHEEVLSEVAAVRGAAAALCPLRVALERVVATPSGNIVACWQVLAGSEPSAIRKALQTALPRAPVGAGQVVRDPEILHTTLARLVTPPRGRGPLEAGQGAGPALLRRAADAMSARLCGLQATLSAMWYTVEEDLLALALNGQFLKHRVPLFCQQPG